MSISGKDFAHVAFSIEDSGFVCELFSCFHLLHSTGFIVSEHLFDKGLKGFGKSLVFLPVLAFCLILVQRL